MTEVAHLTDDQLMARIRMLDNNMRIMSTEQSQVNLEMATIRGRIEDNKEKIQKNKVLPYLVANVGEVIEVDKDETEDVEGGMDEENRKKMAVIVKTTTRQTVFLPVPGLIDIEDVQPNLLVGVNKDNYLILETLPNEYDTRIKAMELDEKPTEDYGDIGGLDK